MKLPRDFDLIVGIPRSGLLVGNLLALHLNLPLADLEGFVNGRVLSWGRRGRSEDHGKFLQNSRRVLVVDDSLYEGRQIFLAKQQIREASLSHDIKYAVAYLSTHKRRDLVDYFYEVVPDPRIFEWNIMHHSILATSCVDIDGVLCRDPTEEENDDGPKYIDFLRNAEPLCLPTSKIGWLVTSRLEKYRGLTIEWLSRHEIQYDNLLMMDLPDKLSRVQGGNHASFKASIYESTQAQLFIESSFYQSVEINRLTGKPVFCFDRKVMLSSSEILRNCHRTKRLLKKFLRDPADTVRHVTTSAFKIVKGMVE